MFDQMSFSDDEIKLLVSRLHPEYNGMQDHWRFLEATYNGGREWFNQNIFRYHKEGDNEFEARIKRAYRFNHTREVVDLINKYLFRVTANRREKDAPSSVQNFWKDVDGRGTNIQEFVEMVSRKSSILGCPYVVVDNTAKDIPENASKAEVTGRIYAYLVSPGQVRDMSWDEDGQLRWILISEVVRDDSDPFESSGREKIRFRLWGRNEWALFEEVPGAEGKAPAAVEGQVYQTSNGSANSSMPIAYQFADAGLHNLGFVPVIRADNILSESRWSVPALINDIAYLDRAVANYLSNLDAIIQDQTFSQLAIPAQGLMPGEDTHAKVIEAGTKRIFTFDGEGGSAPFFLSPDPRQARLIIQAIQQIINEIYHSVGLAGERTKADNSKGIDNSSGVAKAKDFERVNSLLLAKAKAMQTFELKLVKVVAAFGGEGSLVTEDLDLVTYPTSFDVKGVFDEMDISLRLGLLEAPPIMRAMQMLIVADKLFEEASEQEREQLKSEIEQWRRALESTGKPPSSEALEEVKSKLAEEARRNRKTSGELQSKTKSRQESRRTESDQANGRGE